MHEREDFRNFPWDYFPRGRVEIRNNKAIILINPNIIKCSSFKQRIVEEFHLENIKISLHVHGVAA